MGNGREAECRHHKGMTKRDFVVLLGTTTQHSRVVLRASHNDFSGVWSQHWVAKLIKHPADCFVGQ
jgi:hypothetical protein